MKNGKTMFLGGVTLLAAALLLGRSVAAPGDAAAPAPGPRIVVCDVIEVLGRMQRGIDLAGGFQQRGEALRAEGERKTKELRDGKAVLGELLEGTEDFETQYRKLQKLTIELRVWQDSQNASLQRERILLTRGMYREIHRETEALAKERGIDVVLHERSAEPSGNDFDSLLESLDQHKVLYRSDSVDVTDEIVERLNARYEASKGQ
jgi:Skp family chaperone for outer membrane proteins